MHGRATEPPWLILADKIKEALDLYCYDCTIAKTALSTTVVVSGLKESCGIDVCAAIRLTDDYIYMQDKLAEEVIYKSIRKAPTVKIPIAQPNSLDLLFDWLRGLDIELNEDKVADILQ